jgi:hypothetical protein
MKNLIVYTAILGIMLQAGCSVLQVQHEESTVPFGSSTKLAISQQILNPEAGGNAPVVGLDGRYAETISNKYNEGPKNKTSGAKDKSIIKAK